MRTSGVFAVATELQRLQQQLERPPRLLPLPLPLPLPQPLPLPLPKLLARHRLRLQPRLHVHPLDSTRRAVTAVLAAFAHHATASGCCAEPSGRAVRPWPVRLLLRRARGWPRGQVQGQALVPARVALVCRVRVEEWGLVWPARRTLTRTPPPLVPLAHQRGG